MSTTPEASAFPSRSAAEALPWWWQRLNASGAVIEPEGGRQEFPTRGDAESWLGESWAELVEEGVASVTLFEGDREVYGPMSLSAQ
ncbi:hypothetical protein [Nocardioides terrisoli]|uniref:hypothetical protein n=1 Tax=Nocardioides terrisoli TaxID=3388267 RepID=UPI00287BAAB6|nr:hypothetical protein [Nocardioides marmorisolisilvae]